MAAAAGTFEGSCFCGKVRFRAAALGSMSNCFCTDCRKSHAAAFSTYIDVKRKDFAWLKGEDHLTNFKAESGTWRGFCRTCGSILVCWADSDPASIEISASTLDTAIDKKPEYHIFVRSKPAWYDILDGKPQHKAYPEK